MMNNGKQDEFDSRYARRTMILLSGLVLIVMYVEGMLTPSLPSISHTFKVSVSQVSLVLSAYLVSGVALSPIAGKMGDVYGKKKVLVIAMVIYAGAVSVTGFSPNFTFMVVSRAVQGIGLTMMPLGMSLVREEFPRHLVPKAQAMLSAMFGVGFAISLPMGSLISNDFGWRATYHTAVPFVLVIVVLTIVFVRESRFRRPETKIDYVGSALLGSSLSMYVLAISEGPVWGWTSTIVMSLLVAATIVLVPMVLYERAYNRSGGEPILDFRLLSIRNVMIANLALVVSGLGMFLAMQTFTYRFESPPSSGIGLSILGTGLSLVPFALGMIVLGPLTGRWVTRFGVKPFTILGPLVSAAGFILEATVPGYSLMLIYEFIIGGGISMVNASVINLLVLSVDPKDMGLATSMNGSFRYLGSSIGAPIAGAIMGTYILLILTPYKGHLVPTAFPDHFAFVLAFFISAFAFFLVAVICLFSREVIFGKIRSRTLVSDSTENIEKLA